MRSGLSIKLITPTGLHNVLAENSPSPFKYFPSELLALLLETKATPATSIYLKHMDATFYLFLFIENMWTTRGSGRDGGRGWFSKGNIFSLRSRLVCFNDLLLNRNDFKRYIQLPETVLGTEALQTVNLEADKIAQSMELLYRLRFNDFSSWVKPPNPELVTPMKVSWGIRRSMLIALDAIQSGCLCDGYVIPGRLHRHGYTFGVETVRYGHMS